MRTQGVETLLLLMLSLSLAGCGVAANTGATTAPSGAAANLSGNWLLAGSMPSGYALATNSLSVTGTFDVSGNTVSGIVQVQVPCLTIGGIGSPLVVKGTVAADGSITLASVAVAGVSQSFTLSGNVPSSAGGAWTGSFTFTNSGSACAGTTGGPVVATAFPLMTGTYSSTANLGNPLTGLVQAVGLKMMVQQGGTFASGGYSNLPLTGTLTVSNSTCITSGTTAAVPSGGFVEGAQVSATFLMNDGSTVLMGGQVDSLTGSVVSGILLTTSQGTCNLAFNTGSGTLTLTR